LLDLPYDSMLSNMVMSRTPSGASRCQQCNSKEAAMDSVLT